MVSDPNAKISGLSSPLRLLRLTDTYSDETRRNTNMADPDRDPDLPPMPGQQGTGPGSPCSTILEASSSADSLPSLSQYEQDWPEGFLNEDSHLFGSKILVDGLMAEHESDTALDDGHRGSPSPSPSPSGGHSESGNERVWTSNNSTAVEDDGDDYGNSSNSHHCIPDDEWEHGCACRWSEDAQTEQGCESQSEAESESDESSEAFEDDGEEEDPPQSEQEYGRRYRHRYQAAKQRMNSKSGWSVSESDPSPDPGPQAGYHNSTTMGEDSNKTEDGNGRDRDLRTDLDLPVLFDIGVLDLPRTRTSKRADMPHTAAFHWDWWIGRLATEARDIDLKAFLARLMLVREKNDIPRVPTSRVALVPASKDRSDVNALGNDEDQQAVDDDDDGEEEDADADDEDSWLEVDDSWVDLSDTAMEDDATMDSAISGSDNDGDPPDDADDDDGVAKQTVNTDFGENDDSICSNVRARPQRRPHLPTYNNPLSIANALRNQDRSFSSETGWDVFLEHICQKSRHMRDTRRWRMRGLKNAAGWCKWQRGEWIREDGEFVSEREDVFESERTMSEKQHLVETDAAPAAVIEDNRQSGDEIGGDGEQAEDEAANTDADGAQKWTIFVGYRREKA
ncbi:hypothetical protein ABEF95_012226 [Exophiala dermatitidis]